MWRTIILPGGDTLKVWDGIYPAEQIDDILTKALRQPGRNLLRNARWDVLANIVNQRGVTGTISNPGYFIDGWKLISGSVTITAAGLVLNGTMVQILEQGLTSSFTASVLRSDGLFPAQYDNATKTFTITATGQTLIAAKLEAGPNQTVAYQDASGNWVFNDAPPNFALELEKCQRYQYVFGSSFASSVDSILGVAVSDTTAIFVLQFPVEMRGIPTMTASTDNWTWRVQYGSVQRWLNQAGGTLSIQECSPQSCKILLTVTETLFTPGQSVVLMTNPDSTEGSAIKKFWGYLRFDANQ